MVDPDDVEAIALQEALETLIRESRRLPDPEMGLWRFVEMMVAVLLHQQLPGRPLSWVMTLTARRVVTELRLAL